MRNLKLDRIDRLLLEALQQDARLTTAELAERVNLSPSPCARRIRRLEQAGLITRYRAELDRERLGLSITAFVRVRLDHRQHDGTEAFEAAMQAMAEVIDCHAMSGECDYQLHVMATDLHGYEHWLRQLKKLGMVSGVESSFAIRSVKENGTLPLPHDTSARP